MQQLLSAILILALQRVAETPMQMFRIMQTHDWVCGPAAFMLKCSCLHGASASAIPPLAHARGWRFWGRSKSKSKTNLHKKDLYYKHQHTYTHFQTNTGALLNPRHLPRQFSLPVSTPGPPGHGKSIYLKWHSSSIHQQGLRIYLDRSTGSHYHHLLLFISKMQSNGPGQRLLLANMPAEWPGINWPKYQPMMDMPGLLLRCSHHLQPHAADNN